MWLELVQQDPSLLSSARKHGLAKLGYTSLKPGQLSAIDSILRGNTFVSVPTGFGKSLILYQVLPFCADWLIGMSTSSKPVVIVVSPLPSLMHDELAKLASKSIRAICISGKLCSSLSRLLPSTTGTRGYCIYLSCFLLSIYHCWGSPSPYSTHVQCSVVRFVYALTMSRAVTQPPTGHEYLMTSARPSLSSAPHVHKINTCGERGSSSIDYRWPLMSWRITEQW